MPQTSQSEASVCYGCIHLTYTGSNEAKNRTKPAGENPIPLRPEEKLSPGNYGCSKFSERITGAENTPEPLVAGGACKEER